MMRHIRYSEIQWAIAITALWLWLIGPGNIEGKWFPAAAPADIVVALPTDRKEPLVGHSVYKQNGRWTAIWLISARLRHPSCSFARLDWYVGTRKGNHSPATVEFGSPIVRPGGVFTAGPWILNIHRSMLKHSFADAFHQCRFLGFELPWLTKSRFWN